jgi:hypothetical protein
MKTKRRKYEEISPVDFLVLRERIGVRRYRKTAKRGEEERRILLEISLKRIDEKERDDFIPLGPRRRRVNMPAH